MLPLFIDGIVADDPFYNTVRDLGEHPWEEGRKFAESLWNRFESHADKHFRIELQKDFCARFWEMYLTCSMLDAGHGVSCRKPAGPDILLNGSLKPVWIEAVAPGPGEPDSPDQVVAHNGREDECKILRIRGAIREKFDHKYRKYIRDGIVSPKDAYVVAVNGSKIPWGFLEHYDLPCIVRAVYPAGVLQLHIDRIANKVVDRSFTYRDELPKANGSPVTTDIFLREAYNGLSAVIYSCVDPVRREIDYVVVHNSHATVPIEPGALGPFKEFIGTDDGGITLIRDWPTSL